ncbi:MAG: hypothetical protein H6712_30400 [Myxococcales bacterium]|nr:hypothetical protein [Myxococcales bacterium]MCB9718200.1 hypothetical protein [Myxococcales bacterium]
MTIDHYDLLAWLRHNVDDLRAPPDMVTEAEGPTVRFRWHGAARIRGTSYGIGVDLHPGPSLGELWIYGPGARGVRLDPFGGPRLSPRVEATLRTILMDHLRGEHDWGRGAAVLDEASKACA